MLGHPRIVCQSGHHIEVRSKKGIALIALLATAENGERSRNWLQQKLWGSRASSQAQASLRRELSNLRKSIPNSHEWLISANRSLSITVEKVEIDIHSENPSAFTGEFLEGIDLAAEDDFEDWLREMRGIFHQQFGFPRTIPSRTHHNGTAIKLAKNPPKELIFALAISAMQGPHISQDEAPRMTTLTRMIVDHLSRMSWLPVLAPENSHDTMMPVHESQKSRARYVLETAMLTNKAIPHAETKPSLNLTLLEMPLRRVLWSSTDSILDISDTDHIKSIIGRAANMIAQTVDRAEVPPPPLHPAGMADENTAFATIRSLLASASQGDMEAAGILLHDLRDAAGHNSEYLMLTAQHAVWSYWHKFKKPSDFEPLTALVLAAIASNPNDARGPMLLGILDTWQGHWDRAIKLLKRSHDLNPNLPLAHIQLGTTHYLNGNPNHALNCFNTALKLAPTDIWRSYIISELSFVNFMLGNLEAAIDLAEDSIYFHQIKIFGHLIKAKSLSILNVNPPEDLLSIIQENKDKISSEIDFMNFRDSNFHKKLHSILREIC